MSASGRGSAAPSGHPLLQQVPAVHIRFGTAPSPVGPGSVKQRESQESEEQSLFSNVAQVEREELRLCGKNLRGPKKEVDLYEMLFASF